jgi:menaquinone-9 beta-reductase
VDADVVDLVIVGAGPCGASLALHLLQRDPAWAGRIVMLEKGTHPREKLCGGGISPVGEAVLRDLGLAIPEPHFRADRIELVFPHRGAARPTVITGDPALRIVHRAAFDAWLIRQATDRGVRLLQDTPALDVTVHADHLQVTTPDRVLRARVLVAADGANSRLRRALGFADDPAAGDHAPLARLLEVLTPEHTAHAREFRERAAVFDFAPATGALQGYYWDFPSVVDGQPRMNRGVFDSRVCPARPPAALKPLLAQQLAARGRTLDERALQGHPIRWYHPRARYARPRVLLAGDAAGADPLFGEGIPFALAFGRTAARAVTDAFARADFSFARYHAFIARDPVLRQLPARYHAARLLYGKRGPFMRAALGHILPRLVRVLYRRSLRQLSRRQLSPDQPM